MVYLALDKTLVFCYYSISVKKIKKSSKRQLFVGLLILALVGACGFLYNRGQANNEIAGIGTPGQPGYINLEPATEEDKQRADTNKQRLIERQEQEKNQQPQPAGTKKEVMPAVYVGQYQNTIEVDASVASIFEDGGTCIATFTRGDLSFAKSVQAVKNVNTVDCPTMSALISEFSQKGPWSVTVKYTSGSAEGTSKPMDFEVK